jgi:molecular chaperone HtpG
MDNILEKKSFDANVSKLLNLVINSLYTNKDVSIRELISNAQDACEKLRYLSKFDSDAIKEIPTELKIQILLDKKSNILKISDNGIGMDRDNLLNNLGVIANSGTQQFLSTINQEKSKDDDLIGKFGVGFYSAFMVAKFVEVKSSKIGTHKTYKWSSDGLDSYSIEEIDEKMHGTEVSLNLKQEELKYLEHDYINSILEKYSSYLAFPITIKYLDDDDKFQEVDFTPKLPLWRKKKQDITEEEYTKFYKNISGFFDKPYLVIHNHHEGQIEFINLLYIPLENYLSPFSFDKKKHVKLYIDKCFIAEADAAILPNYLRFICGVIEISQNIISLNVSRENFQKDDPIIAKIKSVIVKKIFSELEKNKNNNFENYLLFWAKFGAILKEGIYEDSFMSKEILELCLFYSAIEKKMITLRNYVDKIKNDQKKQIFYLIGDDTEKLLLSPQIEGLISDGTDVLLMQDAVDSFIVSMVGNYDSMKFISAASVGLSSNKLGENIDNDETYTNLTKYFKDCLGDKVIDVKVSKKLISSPICLVTEKGGMDMKMERILINQGNNITKRSPKYLEINVNHPLIKKIHSHIMDNAMYEQSKDIVDILFYQALLIEGEEISHVKEFCDKVNKLIMS